MKEKAFLLTMLFMALMALWPNMSRSETLKVPVPAFTVEIHKTYLEVTEACAIMDPTTNRLMPVGGCWIPATRVLHTIPPTSFCDLVVLQTLGHEVMHVIGWSHS